MLFLSSWSGNIFLITHWHIIGKTSWLDKGKGICCSHGWVGGARMVTQRR